MNPDENMPVRNPIYPWLRVLLWLVPAGASVGIGIAISVAVIPLRLPEEVLTAVWLVLSLVFTGVAGWCDHRLAPEHSVTRTYRPWVYVLVFVLSQLILAPLLVFVVLLGVCAVYGL